MPRAMAGCANKTMGSTEAHYGYGTPYELLCTPSSIRTIPSALEFHQICTSCGARGLYRRSGIGDRSPHPALKAAGRSVLDERTRRQSETDLPAEDKHWFLIHVMPGVTLRLIW